MSYKLSQMAPLPNLKNVEIGNTIGHGGFGVVKTAKVNKGVNSKLIAIKFVHIKMASQQNVTTEMLAREAFIQKECYHRNIIQLIDFGADTNWVWMAMELGSNGDLFDKIEPDIGVVEEVAQFYFVQLINAISFIHSKGVAHRDIKPENLVLDSNGNLKLTDFGLASVFKKKNGPKRLARTPCGSPPYVAPEVVTQKYDPEIADIWSCGIVLFVLLTGKIAWEIPHIDDSDFKFFIENKGEILISPWNKLPISALSLLRKILNPNPEYRSTINYIKSNNWFIKKNQFLNENGMCKDPLKLTAKLLVNLYVSLSDSTFNEINNNTSNTQHNFNNNKKFSETQDVFKLSQDFEFQKNNGNINDYLMDDIYNTKIYQENMLYIKGLSSSQEIFTEHSKRRKLSKSKNGNLDTDEDNSILNLVSKDPALLQFINGSNNQTRSEKIDEQMKLIYQRQKKYPELFAENFTRFFSNSNLDQILTILLEALFKLGFRSLKDYEANDSMVESLQKKDMLNGIILVPISGKDSSKLPIIGNIKITKLADNYTMRKIEFIKIKADPLEWRRLFKKITVLCRDVVYVDSN
ncbi:hypothetical protein B5S31_g1511 [[Candida] boidinii]|nr:hypothetical protein B5S31_g1511 [[Candida] boidinii]